MEFICKFSLKKANKKVFTKFFFEFLITFVCNERLFFFLELTIWVIVQVKTWMFWKNHYSKSSKSVQKLTLTIKKILKCKLHSTRLSLRVKMGTNHPSYVRGIIEYEGMENDLKCISQALFSDLSPTEIGQLISSSIHLSEKRTYSWTGCELANDHCEITRFTIGGPKIYTIVTSWIRSNSMQINSEVSRVIFVSHIGLETIRVRLIGCQIVWDQIYAFLIMKIDNNNKLKIK